MKQYKLFLILLVLLLCILTKVKGQDYHFRQDEFVNTTVAIEKKCIHIYSDDYGYEKVKYNKVVCVYNIIMYFYKNKLVAKQNIREKTFVLHTKGITFS